MGTELYSSHELNLELIDTSKNILGSLKATYNVFKEGVDFSDELSFKDIAVEPKGEFYGINKQLLEDFFEQQLKLFIQDAGTFYEGSAFISFNKKDLKLLEKNVKKNGDIEEALMNIEKQLKYKKQ